MIGVNIEDNRNIGVELKKMVLKLAGFADHILSISDPAVAVDERKLAADNRRRILAALDHYLRKH